MAFDGLHHRLDRWRGNLVRQVGGQRYIVILTLLALNFMIQQQIVKNRSQDKRVLGIGFQKYGQGALTQLAVRLAQQRQDLTIGEQLFFAVPGERKPERAAEFVIQLPKGMLARQVFVVQELFFFFTQGVRLKASDRFQIVLIGLQLRDGKEPGKLLVR